VLYETEEVELEVVSIEGDKARKARKTMGGFLSRNYPIALQYPSDRTCFFHGKTIIFCGNVNDLRNMIHMIYFMWKFNSKI
jgi:hypothetical protein